MQQEFNGRYTADPTHSTVQFEVKHMGVATFRARFADYSIVIDGTGDALRAEGSIPVESVSITAPAELREKVVNGEDFFDGKNHPNIEFVCDKIDLADDGTATADGQLTIRGVTRPFSAKGSARPPVDSPFGGRVAGVDMSAVVDRREWGMDWQMPMPKGGDVLGYDVRLDLQLDLPEEA